MPNYSSTIKSRGFLYLETKKAAVLLLQGLSVSDIKKKSVEENLFLMKTENRKQEIAATVINRLNALDENLIKKVANGDLSTSKLVALYSIIKTDRLFFEFMHEVFTEKLVLRENAISNRDFITFFQRKSEQSEKIAGWADYTHYKLGQVYKRILVEAGLAKEEKDKINICRAILEQEVTSHIKNCGDHLYLKTMTGGV